MRDLFEIHVTFSLCKGPLLVEPEVRGKTKGWKPQGARFWLRMRLSGLLLEVDGPHP